MLIAATSNAPRAPALYAVSSTLQLASANAASTILAWGSIVRIERFAWRSRETYCGAQLAPLGVAQ